MSIGLSRKIWAIKIIYRSLLKINFKNDKVSSNILTTRVRKGDKRRRMGMEYLLMAILIIVPLIIPTSFKLKIERGISKIITEEGVNVKEIVEKITSRERL